MIRKKKQFEWPKKLFDKPRILNENKLVKRYGLKNKKEIWKADYKIKYFRTRAKNLITAEQEKQQSFFNKLNTLGLKIETVADVLALDKEDLLKRRLPSIVVEKGFAQTPKEARQMVIHKRILIGDQVVNIPSYLVRTDEENLISVRKIAKIMKKTKEDKNKSEEPSDKPTDANQGNGELAENA